MIIFMVNSISFYNIVNLMAAVCVSMKEYAKKLSSLALKIGWLLTSPVMLEVAIYISSYTGRVRFTILAPQSILSVKSTSSLSSSYNYFSCSINLIESRPTLSSLKQQCKSWTTRHRNRRLQATKK